METGRYRLGVMHNTVGAPGALAEVAPEPQLSRKETHSTQRSDLYCFMVSLVVLLTLPPTALGVGHTSLADKLSCLLYAFVLEVSLHFMGEVLNSFLVLQDDNRHVPV